MEVSGLNKQIFVIDSISDKKKVNKQELIKNKNRVYHDRGNLTFLNSLGEKIHFSFRTFFLFFFQLLFQTSIQNNFCFKDLIFQEILLMNFRKYIALNCFLKIRIRNQFLQNDFKKFGGILFVFFVVLLCFMLFFIFIYLFFSIHDQTTCRALRCTETRKKCIKNVCVYVCV